MPSLNERQERFCDLVASGLPGGRAYERAGYRARGASADAQASRLVRIGKVSKRIAELQATNRELASMERGEAIRFLEEVIETPIGEVGPDHRLCQEYRETVDRAGVRKLVKMPAKLDAFDKLARMHGWYQAEKHQHSVAHVDPISKLMRDNRERRR